MVVVCFNPCYNGNDVEHYRKRNYYKRGTVLILVVMEI